MPPTLSADGSLRSAQYSASSVHFATLNVRPQGEPSGGCQLSRWLRKARLRWQKRSERLYGSVARFSVSNLLLATTIVAAVTAVFVAMARNTVVHRELVRTKHQLEKEAESGLQRERRDLQAYWGACGDPVLSVVRKKRDPQLFRIRNSKSTSSRRSLHDTLGKPDHFRFEVRLLRSLDGSDYYRLKFGEFSDSFSSTSREVLFAYQGEPLIVFEDSSLRILVTPDRESALDQLSKLYSQEQLSKWRSGPLQLRVEEILWPAHGRPNND